MKGKWSYKPLQHMLVEREIRKTELARKAGISPATSARFGKDQPVSLDVLGRICECLDCRIEDVIRYIPAKD